MKKEEFSLIIDTDMARKTLVDFRAQSSAYPAGSTPHSLVSFQQKRWGQRTFSQSSCPIKQPARNRAAMLRW